MNSYELTYHAVEETTIVVTAGCIGAAVDKGAREWKRSVRAQLKNVKGPGVDERMEEHLRRKQL